LSSAHLDSRLQPNTIPLQGRLKNFNTIEEFRSPDLKKDLFNETVKHLFASFSASATNGTPIPTFNPFLLVSYADLKKYAYHYWFAFPALIQKPAWELVVDGEEQGDGENASLMDWGGDVSSFLCS
jgi:ubiquitin-like modifier-activating enzyme ATG7